MSIKTGMDKMNKRNKRIIIWIVSIFVILFAVVALFGTPSAEMVFRDMNEKMLEVKSVTIDQKLAMKGTAEVSSRMFMDFNSDKELLAKGNFTIDITDASSPMVITGDIVKIGDNNYVRYSEMSSSNDTINTSLKASESNLKNNWVKTRSSDQYEAFSSMPVELMSSILPTPYANLNDLQRKNVLAIIQDKNMYTINESSMVDISGVSAYKYYLTFNSEQYKKAAKAISEYVSYFTSDSDTADEVTSLTVWVDISTKQIIKIEYSGITEQGEVTGSLSFSGYNKDQTVEKPADYSIESELLN